MKTVITSKISLLTILGLPSILIFIVRALVDLVLAERGESNCDQVGNVEQEV